MVNVLAIDDEPLALLQLQKMIEQTPFFTLVGACSNAFDAMRVIQEQKVDAIFADINMPDLSGIDFVRTLTTHPIVVFTTAYSQYAIEGYKVNAVDYLLKPFGMPEFQRAAAKVKQQYDLMHRPDSTDVSDEVGEDASANADECGRIEDDFLFVKADYRLVRISLSDIRYMEAQSEYVRIYMVGGQVLMFLFSIKRMAEILPADRFVRIHRSFLVNMAQVVEIARLRVKMDADTYLPIGDSYKDEVMAYLNNRTVGR
ncbi:MAG: LytTR family DNA-binding domain-containing protein [Bacteroidales bacterium]|nr:LytTR family DNA-binding domain-containing protein [Bacteroidales bacterium]